MLEDIVEYREPYLISHLDIDGEIIKKMGYDSIKIGKILKHLQTVVIEHPEKNSRELLKDEILKISQ